MKVLCVLGEYNYGDPARGRSYEHTNFIPALQQLGNEVVFFESLNRNSYTDFSDLNRRFLQTLETEQPDFIFCVLLGYELWLETLEIARDSGFPIVNWATDDSWKYKQFSRLVAPAFDVYATTYANAFYQAKKDGHKNFLLTQWAANPTELSEPLPAKECRYQVSFIGSAYGNRPQRIAELKERGITVECFGHGWPHGPIAAADIPRIMRESIISINFSEAGPSFHGHQIKARVFEVPGAGGFLLTENAEGLTDYYLPGTEIAVFDNIDDMAGTIQFYLKNPESRDKIAMAGHYRTRNEHTLDIRFKNIIARTLEKRNDNIETHRTINFSKFEHFADTHRPTVYLMTLKKGLETPLTWIFGRKRGPRAARRLLFEISWRMLGRHTYTAAGLPGKLFYKES